jgi:hypothetical protein
LIAVQLLGPIAVFAGIWMAQLAGFETKPVSVQLEFGIDGADHGRPDQSRMRNGNRMEPPLKRVPPERKKPFEGGEAREEIVILPHEGLQQ